jgi:hypothetical protein
MKNLKIIIIDSIASLFLPIQYGGKNKNSLNLMNKVSNLMKYISTEFHISILVIFIFKKSTQIIL